MCDCFDDFEGEFLDDNFIKDHFDDYMDDCELDDAIDEESESDGDSNKDQPECDGFDAGNACLVGGFMGIAYEIGRNEKKRLKSSERLL